ncbi:MAG: hypothetical protein ACJAT7_000007 [Psychromonas sp.]|jgi:hypothetical protein|uniref:hypothetical protein n=1 Tax=Psychromonas sp. TaxID=1884585 RepID=UPI0039E3AED2
MKLGAVIRKPLGRKGTIEPVVKMDLWNSKRIGKEMRGALKDTFRIEAVSIVFDNRDQGQVKGLKKGKA